MADDMELAIVTPVAEFGAVGGGRLVDGDVPVARVVPEGEDLDRVAVVLLIQAQQQATIGGLAAGVGHLLPAQIPIGIEPMRITRGEKQPTRAVSIGQLPEVLLLKYLARRRRGW